MKLFDIIQKFINNGYEISYQDNDRYIELKKMFNNSNIKVDNDDELQIGRLIEICNGQIISKTYMKKGWLWSGSVYTQKCKNNIYVIGTERVIAHY